MMMTTRYQKNQLANKSKNSVKTDRKRKKVDKRRRQHFKADISGLDLLTIRSNRKNHKHAVDIKIEDNVAGLSQKIQNQTNAVRKIEKRKTLADVLKEESNERKKGMNKKISDFITELIQKNETLLQTAGIKKLPISDKKQKYNFNSMKNYMLIEDVMGIKKVKPILPKTNENLQVESEIIRNAKNYKEENIKLFESLFETKSNNNNFIIQVDPSVFPDTQDHTYASKLSNQNLNSKKLQIKPNILRKVDLNQEHEAKKRKMMQQIKEICTITSFNDNEIEYLSDCCNGTMTTEMEVQCEMGFEMYRAVEGCEGAELKQDNQKILCDIGVQCELGIEILRVVECEISAL